MLASVTSRQEKAQRAKEGPPKVTTCVWRVSDADSLVGMVGGPLRLAPSKTGVARATREVASAENSLIDEGSEATLITSALRFVTEHVVRVRDRGGTTEERFPASSGYAQEIRAFECKPHGERSLLPDGGNGVRMVTVTQAVLQAINERRSMTASAVA